MPGIQKAIEDDFGVVAWPAFSGSVGKPSTFAGRLGAMVSAKSSERRRCQGVHQVALDRQHQGPGGLQPQLRLPHPAAQVAGRQGSEAAVRSRRRRSEDLQRDAVAGNPAWTPKMNNAYADAATAIVRKGGDIDSNLAKAEKAVNAELKRLFG